MHLSLTQSLATPIIPCNLRRWTYLNDYQKLSDVSQNGLIILLIKTFLYNFLFNNIERSSLHYNHKKYKY